jgi:hypothetical protein
MLNIRRLANNLSSLGRETPSSTTPQFHATCTRLLQLQCCAASSNTVTEELHAAAQQDEETRNEQQQQQQQQKQQEWLVLNFYHLVDLPDPAEVGGPTFACGLRLF